MLTEPIEAGEVTPVIDRTYALSETREAIGYVGGETRSREGRRHHLRPAATPSQRSGTVSVSTDHDEGRTQIVSARIEGNGGVGSNASNGAPGAGPSGPPPPVGPKRPLGAVIASVVDGTRTLVRKEMELARIEMTEVVSVRAKGVGMMVAAAVVGLFALVFAGASGSAALDLVLPAWAAHLIISVVFVAVAGALVLAGRRAMQTAPTALERTQETLKEDARWAKQQLAR